MPFPVIVFLLLAWIEATSTTGSILQQRTTVRQTKNTNTSSVCRLRSKFKQTFIASNAHPIAQVLRQNEHAYDLLKRLEDYNSDIANQLLSEEDVIRDCRSNPRSVELVGDTAHFYGWGELSTRSCRVLVDPVLGHEANLTSRHPRIMYNDILSLINALNVSEGTKSRLLQSKDILNATNKSWEANFVPSLLQYAGRYRSCDIVASTAFRVRGKWAFWQEFSNDETALHMGKRTRHLLSEAVYLDTLNGTINSLEFKLQKCLTKNQKNGTTIFRRTEGTIGWSIFGRTSIGNNPALLAALEDGEQEEQIALDSNAPSNIAIILLPMALAAVPLALFADVSTGVTLAYAIATDVVSVLPVAIKGIELIVYGRKLTFAARSRVFGPDAKSNFMVTLTWVAKCGIKNYIWQSGLILLSVAVCMMVAGVTLEFVAKSRVQQYKALEVKRDQGALKPMDAILEDNYNVHWRHAPVEDNTPSAIKRGLLWSFARRSDRKKRQEQFLTLGAQGEPESYRRLLR